MVWDLKCRLHHVFNGLLRPYSNIFNFDIVNVHDVFIKTCLIRVTQRLLLVEQELLTLPEHMYSPTDFIGICVARSLFCFLCCPFVLFIFGHCIVKPHRWCNSKRVYLVCGRSWIRGPNGSIQRL